MQQFDFSARLLGFSFFFARKHSSFSGNQNPRIQAYMSTSIYGECYVLFILFSLHLFIHFGSVGKQIASMTSLPCATGRTFDFLVRSISHFIDRLKKIKSEELLEAIVARSKEFAFLIPRQSDKSICSCSVGEKRGWNDQYRTTKNCIYFNWI